MKFTKTILTFLFIGAISDYAFAAKNSERDVENLNDRAEQVFLSMKGVAGCGVQVCDSTTGELLTLDHFKSEAEGAEYCSVLYAESQEAAAALQEVIPKGTRVQGIILTIGVIGKFGPILNLITN